MANTLTSAHSWREFDAWMGSKDRRKVANNTYAERRTNGDIAIRLHDTDIITFHYLAESVTLNSGGWRTVTTKDRMNAILWPVYVFSKDGVWYVTKRGRTGTLQWSEPVSAFYDGMVITPDGDMVSEVLVDDGAKLKAEKKAIAKYVKLYTDEKQAELIQHAVDHGTSGDCWGCLFHWPGSTDHLESHIEEGYVMASLMVNALKHVGYQDWQIPVNVRMPGTVRRAIRRYMVETMTNGNGSHPERPERVNNATA